MATGREKKRGILGENTSTTGPSLRCCSFVSKSFESLLLPCEKMGDMLAFQAQLFMF